MSRKRVSRASRPAQAQPHCWFTASHSVDRWAALRIRGAHARKVRDATGSTRYVARRRRGDSAWGNGRGDNRRGWLVHPQERGAQGADGDERLNDQGRRRCQGPEAVSHSVLLRLAEGGGGPQARSAQELREPVALCCGGGEVDARRSLSAGPRPMIRGLGPASRTRLRKRLA